MADQGISGALTDGSGIGAFTVPKIIKDFIVDVLKTGAAALVASNIVALPTDKGQLLVAATAVIGAAISALYRAVLKWAETP